MDACRGRPSLTRIDARVRRLLLLFSSFCIVSGMSPLLKMGLQCSQTAVPLPSPLHCHAARGWGGGGRGGQPHFLANVRWLIRPATAQMWRKRFWAAIRCMPSG